MKKLTTTLGLSPKIANLLPEKKKKRDKVVRKAMEKWIKRNK